MSNWQSARAPSFAAELRPSIRQVDAGRYKHPGQLQPGSVLVVGAGNSGAEIAREVAGAHQTFLSGPDRGHVPFAINGRAARFILPVLLRVVFHRLLTVRTPVGRKVRRKVLSHGMGWIRVKPGDLEAAGVERVPSAAGVQDGYPALEDGRVLRVDNVIWCTGFDPGFDWIDLPAVRDGKPVHREGIVEDEPGMYFVGLTFLYAVSSSMIHGVGRDAARIARRIEARVRGGRRLGAPVG
jgi:putative flavoprotein involved in K+ transport